MDDLHTPPNFSNIVELCSEDPIDLIPDKSTMRKIVRYRCRMKLRLELEAAAEEATRQHQTSTTVHLTYPLTELDLSTLNIKGYNASQTVKDDVVCECGRFPCWRLAFSWG